MPITPGGHGLGWLKDTPDPRDLLFSEHYAPPSTLPTMVDLRSTMPPIYDQGQLGSCTGNAWAAAYDYERGKQGLPFMTPSRLFIYYNERVIEGTVSSDSGAQIRDGIKTLAKDGVCPEPLWPYQSNIYSRPTPNCYDSGGHNQALQYMSVAQTTNDMMSALSLGFPIVIGFLVYQGYENVGRDGMIPPPNTREKPLGGHANLVVGYDQARRLWITRNSWGTSWGDGGYGYFPFSYLTNPNLASDFWVCEMVEGDTPPPPPPPDTYNVGLGVRVAMVAEGDTPASNETYGPDWSSTCGRSGKQYVWTKSTDKVSVFTPSKVY